MKTVLLSLLQRTTSFVTQASCLVFLLTLVRVGWAQDRYSYYEGKKIHYTLSTEQVFVKLKKTDALQNKRFSTSYPLIQSVSEKNETEGLSLLNLKADTPKAAVKTLLKEINSQAEVAYTSPVLLNLAGKKVGGITDEFVVKLKPGTSLDYLQTLTAQTRTQIVRQYEYDPDTYFITVTPQSEGDALDLANYFYETGRFDYSEPNFLLFFQYATNDTYFNQQYAIDRMQLSGAWNFTTGCSNIKVAVVDSGVQLNHEDLQANLLPGYNTVDNIPSGAPTSSIAHGTNCAGIIAAVGNNGKGIVGVAYTSRVIPINGLGGGDDLINADRAARAINWAWQNGHADVISISWTMTQGQSLITSAIDRAINEGRSSGGTPLGCVVVAATGNDNSAVGFPAKYAPVIAVGASTSSDNRASFSNCGTGLSVVAPGVGIYTTTLNGGYLSNFYGTSAAAPQVAGVVALMLSMNPNLTLAQVRQKLESTADKVGGYNYSENKPNGSWSTQMGYGRVNALNAVLASRAYTVTGPFTICTGGQFSVNNPSGYPVRWVSSPNVAINSSGYATPAAGGYGAGWVQAFITVKGCEAPSQKFDVQVGTYSNSQFYIYSPSSNICPGQRVYFTAMDNSSQAVLTNGVLEYQWTWPSGWTYGGGQNTPYLDLQAPYSSSGGAVTLKVRNACGWTGTPAVRNVMVGYCPGGYSYTYSPNPTNDYLDVTAHPSDSTNSTEATQEEQVFSTANESSNMTAPEVEVKLYNKYSQIMTSGKLRTGRLRLNVRPFPAGIYFLHIIGKDETLRWQIVIEK